MEHICYVISRINDTQQWNEQLAISPAGSGLIFGIKLARILQRSQYVKLMISHGLPYRAIMTSGTIIRGYNDSLKRALFNRFAISSYDNTVRRLPPPYQTNCFDFSRIGFVNEIACTNECALKKTLNTYNKVPFSGMILNQMKERMISYMDVQQESNYTSNENITARVILEIQNNCSRQYPCNRDTCYYNSQFTVINNVHAIWNDFYISYHVPSHPSSLLKSRPWMSTVEYLTYVLSVISTYTGFSIISMNPMLIWKRFNHFKRIITNYKTQERKIIRKNGLKDRMDRHEEVIRDLVYKVGLIRLIQQQQTNNRIRVYV